MAAGECARSAEYQSAQPPSVSNSYPAPSFFFHQHFDRLWLQWSGAAIVNCSSSYGCLDCLRWTDTSAASDRGPRARVSLLSTRSHWDVYLSCLLIAPCCSCLYYEQAIASCTFPAGSCIVRESPLVSCCDSTRTCWGFSTFCSGWVPGVTLFGHPWNAWHPRSLAALSWSWWWCLGRNCWSGSLFVRRPDWAGCSSWRHYLSLGQGRWLRRRRSYRSPWNQDPSDSGWLEPAIPVPFGSCCCWRHPGSQHSCSTGKSWSGCLRLLSTAWPFGWSRSSWWPSLSWSLWTRVQMLSANSPHSKLEMSTAYLQAPTPSMKPSRLHYSSKSSWADPESFFWPFLWSVSIHTIGLVLHHRHFQSILHSECSWLCERSPCCSDCRFSGSTDVLAPCCLCWCWSSSACPSVFDHGQQTSRSFEFGNPSSWMPWMKSRCRQLLVSRARRPWSSPHRCCCSLIWVRFLEDWRYLTLIDSCCSEREAATNCRGLVASRLRASIYQSQWD